MRDVGIRRVVLASSGAIYGEQDIQPLTEGQTPRPLFALRRQQTGRRILRFAPSESCGASRRFPCVFSMPTAPASISPPRTRRWCSYFLRQATRGGTLVVHGDGNQTRDYVYVDDVVSAMMAAATAPNLNGLVINVGSGVETSLRGLTKLMLEVTGSTANVVYNSQTSAGVSRLCADLTLAGQKLGYKPAFRLEEGLRLTLQRDVRYKATKNLTPPKSN